MVNCIYHAACRHARTTVDEAEETIRAIMAACGGVLELVEQPMPRACLREMAELR